MHSWICERARTPLRLILALTAAVLPATLEAQRVPASSVGPALAEQRRLVADDPGSADLWNDLGGLLLLVDRPAEAETAFRMAVAVEEDSATAHYNLGLLLLNDGRGSEGVEHFERVLESDPRHGLAHFQIGAARERAGDRDGAIAAYAKAFELDANLAFADVNPQIIESDLVLEALLHRDDATVRVSTTSSVFRERERLVELLVPPLEPAPSANEGEEESKSLGEGDLDRRGSLNRVRQPQAAPPPEPVRRRRLPDNVGPSGVRQPGRREREAAPATGRRSRPVGGSLPAGQTLKRKCTTSPSRTS